MAALSLKEYAIEEVSSLVLTLCYSLCTTALLSFFFKKKKVTLPQGHLVGLLFPLPEEAYEMQCAITIHHKTRFMLTMSDYEMLDG